LLPGFASPALVTVLAAVPVRVLLLPFNPSLLRLTCADAARSASPGWNSIAQVPV
jgi:hypothetical protein